MIKIQSVEIKQTKTGKDYKFLTLDDNTQVAMWLDDPDYELAESGVEIDRATEKNGKWINLLPKSEKSKQNNTGDVLGTYILECKLDAIYWLLQQVTKKYDEDMLKVFEKIGIEYKPFERIKQSNSDYPTPEEQGIDLDKMEKIMSGEIQPEQLDINPDNIPF